MATHTLTTPHQQAANTSEPCLLDLMYDGFYLLFLLKAKHPPSDAEVFRDRIKQFLSNFERQASKLNADTDAIYACKYAFCATIDEAILMSQFRAKESWQRMPLQVQYFGEQLAGEQFFTKLEELRRLGASQSQVLEVFHMCLLLGFQGKYLMEGSEKLNYLTARLGDEIAHLKGRRAAFAPHWQAPDRVTHQLKNEVPLWVVASVLGALSLLGFLGLRLQLSNHTDNSLSEPQHIVQLAPQAARITVTLP